MHVHAIIRPYTVLGPISEGFVLDTKHPEGEVDPREYFVVPLAALKCWVDLMLKCS